MQGFPCGDGSRPAHAGTMALPKDQWTGGGRRKYPCGTLGAYAKLSCSVYLMRVEMKGGRAHVCWKRLVMGGSGMSAR